MNQFFKVQKNGADDQCFRAQSLLHPTCAQTPAQWSQREEDLPSCHSLARKCRKEADCRSRLERYEQACSVDSKTKTCSGPYDACRSAMVDILGTELRTNCACTGTAGDFRELFECIGYQRLFWVNPCVVDAQKDYHLKLGNTGSSVTEWTPTEPVWERTPSPTLPQTRPKPPPRTRKPKPPVQNSNEVDTPTYPRRITTVELPEDAMTPFPPTKRPSYPKMPQRTTRSTRKPRRRTTKKSQSPVTPKTTTPTTLPPKYCTLEPSGNLPGKQYIREGFEKRLYSDDKEGSKLCSCKGGANLECTMLPEIKKKPCNTGVAFYSHASPFYQAYRGQCLCYSGEFICAKPPKPPTKKKQPAGSVSASPPGVFLYLGFSKIDFNYLKNGRIKLEDKVPLNLEEAEAEVKNTVQQTVSHFTSNTNKTECRISQDTHIDENYILKATLDEYDEYRKKKNMSDYMKWREKEECFEALESIAVKVNQRDADMRSHIVLSMFKVAHAEANVPSPPPSHSLPLSVSPLLLPILLTAIFLLQS